MPWFAVYYVPDAQDDFYRLGSSIVGYDVRARETVPLAAELREALGQIDDDWVKSARGFGLHMTISDLIEVGLGDILDVEHELQDILGCFDPSRSFTLRRRSEGFAKFWGPQKETLVLPYEANPSLLILHTLIVACFHRLGTASVWQERLVKDPARYATVSHVINKIMKFGTLNGLDSWSPHFTLLNPYNGQDHDRYEQVISGVFDRFSDMTLNSICLLMRGDDGRWQIYKEFKCPTAAR